MHWKVTRCGPTRVVGAGVLLGLMLSGCATAPKQEQVRLVWPAPPLTTRIQFVRSVVSEEDVGRDTTFSQKVVNFLSGVTPPPKRIVEPTGLAVSDDGQRLYVANFSRGAVFTFDFAQQTFSQIESLAHPFALALDADERLYVVEQLTKEISVFDRDGDKLRSLTHASIERPTGIAIDRRRGQIYLADAGGRKAKHHSVKVFDMEGKLLRSIGQEKGGRPGQFMYPTYLTVDPGGNLYVTDTLNARVQVFDPEGNYVKSIGERGNAWGMFDKPKGVALDSFGNVYVVDAGWSNVQIFNPKGQVLLFFGGRGPIPGLMKNPTAIVIDPRNHIYVADFINHRVNIYQLVNTKAEDSYLDPYAETKGGAEGGT